MKQKSAFLQSEGNAWFSRNRRSVEARKLPDEDLVLQELLELIPVRDRAPLRILEIGCGDGTRLAWLKDHMAAECHGIDPSADATTAARARNIDARQGTADELPYGEASMDVLIFGFCLYVCDRADLFRIAAEADRVLRSPGSMLILDFYSTDARAKPYHHRPGLLSYKMDYRTLFTWHPDYTCLTHKVRHHETGAYTDSADNWIAVSVLRKGCREPST